VAKIERKAAKEIVNGQRRGWGASRKILIPILPRFMGIPNEILPCPFSLFLEI